MKLTFIANACEVLEYKNTKIITDPWLIDGAFYGSWYHPYPLRSKPEDFKDVDGVYVSHIHPDHYDVESLKRMCAGEPDKPIFILDTDGPNFLYNAMKREGFENIVKLQHEVPYQFKDMELTIFKPFIGNNWVDNEVGNPLDSALLVRGGEHTVMNFNDNTPDLESCRYLREKYGQFTVAQLNYNNAGPYPACFMNLSLEDKRVEATKCVERNLNLFRDQSKALSAKYTMPFAGAYILGGKNWRMNPHLGVTSSVDAMSIIDNPLRLEVEGDSVDLETGEYEIIPHEDRDRNINQPYDYEHDFYPPWEDLSQMAEKAALRVKERTKDIKSLEGLHVEILTGDLSQMIASMTWGKTNRTLRCWLDERLLYRILTLKANWNNAEIGCHIQFDRSSDRYDYDFHMSMAFFHAMDLPKS